MISLSREHPPRRVVRRQPRRGNSNQIQSSRRGNLGSVCKKKGLTPFLPSDQLWAANSELAFCGQLTTKQCVIRARFAARRNMQFEQEFFDPFLGETVSAYNRRDRVGDFCVADYLAKIDTVHVMRYSTRLVSACAARPHALPTSDNHGERMLSACATERASASFITSGGTQIRNVLVSTGFHWQVVLVPYFGELFLAVIASRR